MDIYGKFGNVAGNDGMTLVYSIYQTTTKETKGWKIVLLQ